MDKRNCEMKPLLVLIIITYTQWIWDVWSALRQISTRHPVFPTLSPMHKFFIRGNERKGHQNWNEHLEQYALSYCKDEVNNATDKKKQTLVIYLFWLFTQTHQYKSSANTDIGASADWTIVSWLHIKNHLNKTLVALFAFKKHAHFFNACNVLKLVLF